MVNLEAAQRQALGANFVARPDDPAQVADLLAGRLTLPPHAPWTLPGDPTWSEDPFSDNNWQFQYHMLRWLDPLRRAGQAGDADAAAAWEHYARSWVEANPPGDSRSRWAWMDMTDGIRALELCHGLCVVGEQDWLIRSLEQHRDWLSDPAHIKHGNHGLHQTVGLFVVAAVLEDSSVMDSAVASLGERLRGAWDEQGVNEEGSLAYHRMNYHWWQDTMVRLDLEGVDRPAGAERLELAPMEMAHATSPLGKLARIGDTNAASISDVDHPSAQYVTSNGAEGTPPKSTTAVFDGGYAYVRSGWGESRPFTEETFLTAVFGPQNKVHGHRDGGSITYCSKGTQWLQDQGRFYYGKEPMQRYMASRESHSLIVLPGRTARTAADVELTRHRDDEHCTDLLLADPSYDGVQITRRIIYLKHWDLTLILDRVQAAEEISAEQRWHCGRGVDATALSLGFSLSDGDQTCHVAALTGNARRDVRRGQKDPLLGWTSTGWRKSAPVDVATVYDRGTDMVFGALLGTWTPAAVDLLTARLAGVNDVTAPVDRLIPSALLASPWDAALTSPARGTTVQLEVSAETIGPDLIRVTGSGAARYFAFDLFDEGRPVVRTSWRTRADHTFDVAGLTSPRIQVRSRTTSADVQRASIGHEAWRRPRAEHGLALPEAAPVRTLVLLETMFCDNEKDPAVLAEYFSRFSLCLRSLMALQVPRWTEVVVTIYMSADKSEYVRAVHDILADLREARGLRLRIRVVEYDHPAEGYPENSRIDWLKSPNKHAPYRDDLFRRAHESLELATFDQMIRMAIDDDDLMLPTHIETMVDLAHRVLADAPGTDVVVMGPLRTYVAYVGDDGVQLEDVEMRRSLTGNKSFVIRNPSMDAIDGLSPWSVPELMTAVQRSAAQARGQQLRPVHGNRPGFVYMRWGQNLSSHRKDFHITTTTSTHRLAAPADLLSFGDQPEQRELSFDIVPLDLRATARRRGGTVTVTSNFDKLRAGSGHVCFQVFHGGQRIASTPYSRRADARFDDVPAGSVIRGFVRVDGEIVGRCRTEAV
ncbi:heparinase II/III-family protein [Kocuria palustris]|uniref:heparinase II/III-family protein n=1 Tax=Kocuria palustris TaxID=71999 RepID=UPI0021A3C3EF|nr:heparinase II/III-family protein [Kocuria palustris]MCT1834426.1 heparinase II/III-family protein [Kocuria palustris]